ncbi:hypothetical protein HDU97_000475 [Phlyctochytrium planicorne]|nr:hypothetical protein HDU97_000475 [Phlyctochytrium planicorne]
MTIPIEMNMPVQDQDKDVLFCTRGLTFSAHSIVIAARSPTFHQELSNSSITPSPTNPLTINQPDIPASSVECLLYFIYNGHYLPPRRDTDEQAAFGLSPQQQQQQYPPWAGGSNGGRMPVSPSRFMRGSAPETPTFGATSNSNQTNVPILSLPPSLNSPMSPHHQQHHQLPPSGHLQSPSIPSVPPTSPSILPSPLHNVTLPPKSKPTPESLVAAYRLATDYAIEDLKIAIAKDLLLALTDETADALRDCAERYGVSSVLDMVKRFRERRGGGVGGNGGGGDLGQRRVVKPRSSRMGMNGGDGRSDGNGNAMDFGDGAGGMMMMGEQAGGSGVAKKHVIKKMKAGE